MFTFRIGITGCRANVLLSLSYSSGVSVGSLVAMQTIDTLHCSVILTIAAVVMHLASYHLGLILWPMTSYYQFIGYDA